MKRYNSYKDSGVEWIGEIPSGWFCVGTNKVYQDLGTGTTPTSDNSEYYDEGGHHWITTTDLNEGIMYDTLTKISNKSLEDYANLKLYPSGSIFISMYGGRIGKLGVSTFDSYCNQSVCVLPKSEKINVKFYYYWFLGFQDFVKNMGRGGGQPNINKDMIKQFPTVKPPLSEQHQIVSYLDRKTAQIDSLIEKTQRKIELLKENRTSLINEAVTKGLNPHEEMKDSGVEWIGEIPRHWEVKRLKYFCEMVNEKGLPTEGDVKISPENVESNTGVCFNLYSEYSGEGVKFTDGDILLNKLRLYLKKILFTEYEGYSMGEMIVLRVFHGVKRFYFLTFFHQGLIDELDNQSTGVKLPRVSPELILNTKLPYPPLHEQQEIVSYLDEHTQLIDKTVSVEERRIELLKAYRQSLISEVVTGKRKVVN